MSPTPLSLLCAILLTLPLAIVFTINSETDTTVSPPSRKLKTHLHKPFLNKTDHTDEDDNSLLQLASRVNPNPLPIGAPRKVAFMFLTTGPLPLAPLWELYFNRTKTKNLYNIYIHSQHNLKHDLLYQGVFSNRTIFSKATRRHTPSLAAAHRRLLSHALLHDPANYMFALLSPSCIPLHSFDFTYETLIKSNKSFIEILGNEFGAWDRWAARGGTVMLPEVEFDKFRIGSQFSVLTRHHATLAVSDTRLWSKFKLPCQKEKLHTCYPEESYLPTLLSKVDSSGCVPATLTYVDWNQRHDGHPHTFHGSDVGPDLISTLRKQRPRYGDDVINSSDTSMIRRNDPFLFARKFGSDTIGALLDIADYIVLRE